MRTMRRYRALAAVIVVGALAACSGQPGVTETTEPTEPPTTSVPTSEPTPTEDPSEVLPANDVEDPIEALHAIWAYYDYLAANPDPDKLELIFQQACECYESARSLLEQLDRDGSRITAAREIRDVEILDQTETTILVRYHSSVTQAVLIRGDGSREEADDAARIETSVLVFDRSRWRVRDTEVRRDDE